MHGRYMKAKQFKRAASERRKLKTYAGRVQRDLERKLSDEAREQYQGMMILAELAPRQEKKTEGKVYSMHAPGVERVATIHEANRAASAQPMGGGETPRANGSSQMEGAPAPRVRGESGAGAGDYRRAAMARRVVHVMSAIRTSLATTAWGGFAVGAMALPGNPFDGHTLGEQLEQVGRLTGVMPKRCHVDRGYKGHGVESETCRVIIAGSKKGISKAIKKVMKRGSGIEPEIGHQKSDGKLGLNWLKGMLGDAQNAILCAAGHNLRKILAHLRRLFVLVWAWLMAALRPQPRALAQEAVPHESRIAKALFQDRLVKRWPERSCRQFLCGEELTSIFSVCESALPCSVSHSGCNKQLNPNPRSGLQPQRGETIGQVVPGKIHTHFKYFYDFIGFFPIFMSLLHNLPFGPDWSDFQHLRTT
jgi:hypothetical protein